MQTEDTPTVIIRPAVPTDVPALGRLGALLMRIHHDFDPQRFMAAPPNAESSYAAFLGGQLEKPNTIVLVAELDSKVIGYGYAGVEGTDYMALRGPAGMMYDLIVDPDHRGHGAGRMLIDALLAALKARGAPRAVLSTAYLNTSAHPLFARAGFRPTMIEMTRELDDDPS